LLLLLSFGAPLFGQGLTYLVEFFDPYNRAASLATARHGGFFLSNLIFYPRFLFVTNMFRWPWGSLVLDAATVGLALTAVCYGVRDEGFRSWRKFAQLTLAVYIGVHLVWSAQGGRYLLPVVPFAAAYFFRGLGDFFRRTGLGEKAVVPALLLSLLLCAAPDARIIGASLRGGTPLTEPPERTLGWIRGNTAGDAVFAAELDGRLFLLTGRSALRVPRLAGANEFRRWLGQKGIGYVLVFPNDYSLKTSYGTGPSDPLPVPQLRALLSDCGARRVFVDSGEGSEIWRVVRAE
jgi:hypothetical protein